VEAIALAHDLGHTPFGHAGQDALHTCMQGHGGFEHNLQSLRVVDELEIRYPSFDGLNLCFETREGILKHCSPRNAQRLAAAEPDGPAQRFLSGHQPSLEAQLVNLADEMGMTIHYWHVMDSGKDSVDLLKKLLDRFGTGMKYVLVRNQIRGNDFSVLEQSGEQARAMQLGARVVSIKKLGDSVINRIDAGSSSFWKAKNPQDPNGGGLGLMDRQRVKAWLRDAYREIDDVGV